MTKIQIKGISPVILRHPFVQSCTSNLVYATATIFLQSHFFDESTKVFTKEQLKDGVELFAMTQQIYQQSKDDDSLAGTNFLQTEIISETASENQNGRCFYKTIQVVLWYYREHPDGCG